MTEPEIDSVPEALPADVRPTATSARTRTGRLPLEPMDVGLTSIQPGGGVVVKLELAWGYCRRGYLRIFRPGYVSRMRQRRRGERGADASQGDTAQLRTAAETWRANAAGGTQPLPHDILDPRDLKYCRNQTGWHWGAEDDAFAWRDRLPFARAGLAELMVFSTLTFLPAMIVAWYAWDRPMTGLPGYLLWALASALVVVGGLIVWFFRDPPRVIPAGSGLVVSPADGKIVSINELAYDGHIDGPAVVIGIFLSIFNVHINRMPLAARVIGLTYRPGKYLNALRPASVQENEQLAIRLEENSEPYRRLVVRQIAGAIARRIVCWLKPGDELARGQQFGMIKLGSRTELVLPYEAELLIQVSVGQKVSAGSTILARYDGPNDED